MPTVRVGVGGGGGGGGGMEEEGEVRRRSFECGILLTCSLNASGWL